MSALASLKLIGFEAVSRSMERKRKKLKDQSKANAQAVVIADRWIQKNFQEQGKAVGGWQPLAPATMAARRRGKKPLGTKILIDTGELRRRWKHLYNSKMAAIQSGVDYAEKHEKGIGVPKRRILPESKDIMPDLKKIFGEFIEGIINDKF